MYSSVSHIEEIPPMDYVVPEIRLKIIHLNLNERGESLTPPPRAAGEGSVLQRYVRQPVVRKRLHKLESYDHLLHQLRQGWPVGCGKRLLVALREGVMPSQHCPKSDPYARDSPSPVKHEQHNSDKDSGVFRRFVKGIRTLSGDGESISRTIVRLINKHTLSVAKTEQLLFEKTETLSNKSTLNDIIFQSALMAMNELLDDGVLDISRRDMVRVGQCLTFSLFFHKTLQQMGKDMWRSTYAQVIRDAWMSFGCLGAMFIVSSMRQ